MKEDPYSIRAVFEKEMFPNEEVDKIYWQELEEDPDNIAVCSFDLCIKALKCDH